MGLEEIHREKNEYDYLAPIYDPLFYAFLRPIRKTVLNMLSSYTNKRVIDVCCGTGNQLKILAKNGFTDLSGVDLSEAMLSVAKKSNEKIEFYNRDATETGFAGGTFDAALISFALHEKTVSVQEGMIKEVFRILRKEGILIVVDYELDNKTNPMSNIAISLIERSGSEEHLSNFMIYVDNNGLKGIICDNHFQLQASERKMLGGVTVNQYIKT